MERGLNKLMIIGFVESDPEMRFTPNGRPVTTFTVGAPRTWTTADGVRSEEIEWFNVVAWGALAEVCKAQLAKDYTVFVEGRIHTRTWDDEAGRRHSRAEVVANQIVPLNDRRQFLDEALGDGSADGGDYAF